MVKKYIVTKKLIAFELHIDGKVEVTPLPNNAFSKETITTLAEVYKSIIYWHRVKNEDQNLEEIAIRYFENKGFEIVEKENTK